LPFWSFGSPPLLGTFAYNKTGMPGGTISIRRVLSEIYTNPEPFALGFVTLSGKHKWKESVRLGGAGFDKPKPASGRDSPTRKGRRIKEGHLLFLYCNHEKHPFHLRITLLTFFNGLRIRHTYGK
jgi:hypothetical protein